MLVYTSSTLIWYATLPLSDKKRHFDPTPGVEGVCKDRIFAFMVLCAQFPLISYATWLLSDKKKFDLLTPPQGRGCICGQNICYHVAACICGFNLICNMTIFRKRFILDLAPPLSPPGHRTQAFRLKSCLTCFISISPLPACKISAKNFNNCLS